MPLPCHPSRGLPFAHPLGGRARLPESWAEPRAGEGSAMVPRTAWLTLPGEEEGLTQAREKGRDNDLKGKGLPGPQDLPEERRELLCSSYS